MPNVGPGQWTDGPQSLVFFFIIPRKKYYRLLFKSKQSLPVVPIYTIWNTRWDNPSRLVAIIYLRNPKTSKSLIWIWAVSVIPMGPQFVIYKFLLSFQKVIRIAGIDRGKFPFMSSKFRNHLLILGNIILRQGIILFLRDEQCPVWISGNGFLLLSWLFSRYLLQVH